MAVNGRVMLMIWNDEEVERLARSIALKQFQADPAIRELFAPLMEEVQGAGPLVTSEVAWKLFLWLQTSASLNGKGE